MHLENRGLHGALFAAILSLYALRKGSLTVTGSMAAWVVGFCTYLASGWHVAVLLMFFFGGTKLTKVGPEMKALREENYASHGGRDHYQVLANGGLGTVLSLLWINDKSNSCLLTAFLIQYAVVAGDTFASEIGILNTSKPRLIFGFKEVPHGTNGGVTLLGTAASIVGGFSIGAISLTILPPGQLSVHPIVLGAVGGFIGSIVDSLLGQFLEYSGSTPSGVVTNNPTSKGSVRIPGTWLTILNGNHVNFLASVITTSCLTYITCV